MNPDGAALRTRRNANRGTRSIGTSRRWLPGPPVRCITQARGHRQRTETKAFATGMEQIHLQMRSSADHQRANLIDRGTARRPANGSGA